VEAAEVATRSARRRPRSNSLLQRARAQLEAVGPSEDEKLAEPDSPETRICWTATLPAFENYDIDKLVELFTADAVWEIARSMVGIRDLTTSSCSPRRTARPEAGWGYALHPHHANGQPAAALYVINRKPACTSRSRWHVMAVRPDGSRTSWLSTCRSFEKFGLPLALTICVQLCGR